MLYIKKNKEYIVNSTCANRRELPKGYANERVIILKDNRWINKIIYLNVLKNAKGTQ